MKVLVPLDGSARSLDATVRALGMLTPAEVELICVQAEGFEGASEDIVAQFDDDADDEIFPTHDSAQRMLDDAAKACAEAGHTVTTRVMQGKLRQTILAASAEADLMIMHRLDKSGLKEKLKMSGTEWLCRNAGCSVLLVDD